FTRGHWNDTEGYTHAWASPEDEAVTEAAAEAVTAAQKAAVEANNVWALYDAAQSAEGKAKDKAVKTYEKALAKAKKQMAAQLAKK
ncbi:MAG: glycosyl hydrolase, partial [Duncaniella sp.]|nr:glycosyl hydrolase [Duncaniella sp.]